MPDDPNYSPDATPGSTPEQDTYTVEFWTKELAASNRWMDKYHRAAERIEREYLSESDNSSVSGSTADEAAVGRYNLFWSNTQVMGSLLLSRMPTPEVNRTHLDPADDEARVAASMLERVFAVETVLGAPYGGTPSGPFDTYRHALQDRLLGGMGIAWARFSFREQQIEIAPADPTLGTPAQSITLIVDEACPLDYVRWDDFRMSPAPTWDKVEWVGRRVPMVKKEVEARFGAEIAEAINYSLKSKKSKAATSEVAPDPYKAMVEPMADIWELWCKSQRTVYWICQGYDAFLDTKQDPLKLTNFFPTPRPLIATTTTKAFLPRADYVYVQDQYQELNVIAIRTKMLTEALRVVGVYDKTSTELKRLLDEATMNTMIPVDNWAMFAEKGGIKGIVDWFPLEQVVNALEKLTMRKSALVQEIYEIIGISDIMRGTSSPYETAAAQKLKANFGTARSDTLSNDVAMFITSCTRMRAEIICRHWSPKTILERSQVMFSADGQNQKLIAGALKLLKSDPMSVATRLNISADSITAPDWQMEKQQRIDFLQAISQFIGMATPLVQQYPGMGIFVIQMIQWAASGFKAGKQIEGVLDQLLQSLQTELTKPKPPTPPTPQEQKDLASADKTYADAKKTNLETILTMAQAGVPPQAYPMLPPLRQPGQPPQSGPQPPGTPGKPPMVAGPAGPQPSGSPHPPAPIGKPGGPQ